MTIDQLTPEQEAYLPIFREEYFQRHVSKTTNKDKIKEAIAEAYKECGYDTPRVFIFQSPLQTLQAIEIAKEIEDGPDVEDRIRQALTNKSPSDKPQWNGDFLYGSHDLYWIAWAKFAEHIGVKYEKDVQRQLDIMDKLCSECEWWWPFEGVCFVSQRPVETSWEDSVLHNPKGPSVLYEDGFSLYSWRGVTVPDAWITNPETMKAEEILRIENTELRRSGCEIMGWNNILKSLNATVIDVDDDPEIGTLLEVDFPDSGREKFLRVLCGTGREFALPVPPEMSTALQANAWTYGIEDFKGFKPEVRT